MKNFPYNKIFFLKLLSFVPASLLLCLIFGFSAQTGDASGSLSFQVSLFLVRLFSPILPAADTNELLLARAEAIHFFVRKAAHMTEYFLLMLSVYLPVSVWLKNRITFRIRIFLSFCLTVLFAAFDEFHQSFVDGRSGNFVDVCIDSIGILAATVFLFFLTFLKRKRANQ